MAVRCIGQVTTEHAGLTDVVLALGGIDDKKEKERTVSGMEYFYFQLGEKRYVPLTDDGVVDQSEKRCKTTLERSKRQPQPVGEVVQTRTSSTDLTISPALVGRLWLYDGKLYKSTRNDYGQDRIRLLILDFLDKEARRFKDLQRRFNRE